LLPVTPDAIMQLGFALGAQRQLERNDGLYSNWPAGALFPDRRKPTYVGGIL
jgi:hypothetical protein